MEKGLIIEMPEKARPVLLDKSADLLAKIGTQEMTGLPHQGEQTDLDCNVSKFKLVG